MGDNIDNFDVSRNDVFASRTNDWTIARDRYRGTPNRGRIEDKGGEEKRRC
jgi:isoleucyl-tRNA synthetase